MADPGQYTYDAHLRDADSMVVRHIANNPSLLTRVHAKAYRDVRQRLKAHGYLDAITTEAGHGRFNTHTLNSQQIHPPAEPRNDFDTAVASVKFTAKTTGGLTVPEGTALLDVDPDDVNEVLTAARRYTTNEELVLTAGSSGTVDATAENDGAAHNLPVAQTLYLADGASSLANFSAAELAAMTTSGVDHQLTRVTAYRALQLIYLELMVRPDDAFANKLKIYEKWYEMELKDLVSGGIIMEVGTEDSTQTIEEERLRHGFHRFQRR